MNHCCSETELFSKICDYLAAGRPIIATRVGDIVDLFDNNIGYFGKNDNNKGEESKTPFLSLGSAIMIAISD